jgi:hypothetical protein
MRTLDDGLLLTDFHTPMQISAGARALARRLDAERQEREG